MPMIVWPWSSVFAVNVDMESEGLHSAFAARAATLAIAPG